MKQKRDVLAPLRFRPSGHLPCTSHAANPKIIATSADSAIGGGPKYRKLSTTLASAPHKTPNPTRQSPLDSTVPIPRDASTETPRKSSTPCRTNQNRDKTLHMCSSGPLLQNARYSSRRILRPCADGRRLKNPYVCPNANNTNTIPAMRYSQVTAMNTPCAGISANLEQIRVEESYGLRMGMSTSNC